MSGQEPMSQTEYNTCRGVINAFLIALLIACLLFAGFVVSRVAAANDPLCEYFEALSKQPGIEVATWIGYPDGWQDYPQQWDYETFLPILQGVILQRVYKNQQWLWGYRTLDTWTDASGEHDGNHDFCDRVLIIKGP